MKKLLIVEDEKMIRQGIKSIAMRAPVIIEQIIECKNGEEALEVIRNEAIDVMITDIRMPGKDGITLVKEMQDLPHVPKTIVISGYDDFNYAVELLRCGAKDYLLKPIEREKIFEVLKKLEQELEEEKEEEKKRTYAWQQQLRYRMLEDVNAEKDDCREEFELFFKGEPYLVCCVNTWKDGWLKEAEGIGLKKMQKQCIYIINTTQKNLMGEQFLQQYTGVSKEHTSFEELKIAYKEAVSARKQAYYQEIHLMDWKESNGISGDKHKKEATTDAKNTNCEWKDNEIDQYIQLFGTNKWEQNDKFLRNLHYYVKSGKISPNEFEHAMNRLVEGIKKTYEKVIDVNDAEILHQKSIYEYDTVVCYLKDFMEALSELHSRIVTEFSDFKNKQKIQTAIVYITQNYNKDLNMAVVSNYISMNYSLFSYAFKQYTGTYFVQYLKDLRIAKAKELLAQTEKKIVEISNEVGYENEKHFMKIFKSHCGVSPSEYRKNAYVGNQRPVR